MSSLQNAIDRLSQDGGEFVIDAPEDWAQGRTLYGGMTAALAYEAVKRSQPDLAPLRSAQFAFIGPATGRLRFSPMLLRRGRSSTIVAVDCANEEGPVARATFVFGAARESVVAHDYMAAPAVPAADACGRFRNEDGAHRGFWNNFETRLAMGGRLFDASAPRPEFGVWVRYRDPGDVDSTTALLAAADCLPPAAMVHFPKPAPISSMTWGIDLMRIPASAEGWRLLWATSEHTAGGYSMQSMMMWDEAGAPLAVGRQAVAIFV